MIDFLSSEKIPPVSRGIAATVISIVLLAFSSPAAGQWQFYEGPEWCKQCHEDNYNDWRVSGHAAILMKGEEARHRSIPLPRGFDWDDISYVIGGYKWKSRYMDNDGYIITNDDSIEGGSTQYNFLTDHWSDYHADQPNGTKPYDCGACHTTAWIPNENPADLSGNQDGLPGLHGRFFGAGVQCEQCHGPGFDSMEIDSSAEFCGTCHTRGDPNAVPASGGFIRHQEQYNELLAGAHGSRDCVMCHDPHKRAEFSIKEGSSCGTDCHQNKLESYSKTSMFDYGVTCEDCHMPYATRSAQALGPHQGDVRTHIYYIDTDPDANMFTEDGSFVKLDDNGKAAVTMDFACQRCHETASLEELALFAEDFHAEDKGLENFGLDPGLTGTWWNAGKSGEGFLLEVDRDRFLFASFYTYGPDGEQTWLIAQLDAAEGTTANVKVYIPAGGEWGDPSGAATGVEWGSGTFEFPTCSSASFSFTPNQAMMDLGFTAQSYALERTLDSGIRCPTFTNNEMAAAMP